VLKVSNDTKHVQNPKSNKNILAAKNKQNNIKKCLGNKVNMLENTRLNKMVTSYTILRSVSVTILNNQLSIKQKNKANHRSNEKTSVVLVRNVNDVHFCFLSLGFMFR
jgi:hypothetical protein